jgi:ribose transport system ATP-binding protein
VLRASDPTLVSFVAAGEFLFFWCAMNSVPSLELSGISKRYPGVQALDHVDFECRAGEIHAVLGENGSGKSALLGIAAGAVAADEGRVAIMGKVLVAADPKLARQLGLAVVYQDDSLVRELSVAENLLLWSDSGPLTLAGTRQWAARQLAPYDLGISPDALVGQLSSAQRQFLEIVKALAANPKVLLLDEPTSSLDISGVEKLTEIVRRIVGAGVAVVYGAIACRKSWRSPTASPFFATASAAAPMRLTSGCRKMI